MAEAPPSEAVLLQRAREGDAGAFGELVERNQDYVYNVIFHMTGAEQDADDIAQEVFARAFSGLSGFRGKARFSTWLFGITVNCVRSFWRRGRIRQTAPLAAAEAERGRRNPDSGVDGPVETALSQERVRIVRRAIAGLDEDLREVIVLRDIQGLSYRELAEAVGVAMGTVKSRLHRARLALKQRLEPYYGQET